MHTAADTLDPTPVTDLVLGTTIGGLLKCTAVLAVTELPLSGSGHTINWVGNNSDTLGIEYSSES